LADIKIGAQVKSLKIDARRLWCSAPLLAKELYQKEILGAPGFDRFYCSAN